MSLICKECGISLDKEKSGRYYCPNCKKYTDFFQMEDEPKKD